MPISILELVQDLPALLALVQKISDGVAKLPKPPEPISAKAFGDLAASALPDLGALIDQIRAQAAS